MIRRLHKLLGLVLAVYLLALSLSGVILLWSGEFLAWQYPDAGEFDASALTKLTVADDPSEVVVLNSASRPVLHVYRVSGAQHLADPASGEVLGQWHRTTSMLALLFELHVFLLAGELGHDLVGIFGILTLALLALGLVLFLRRRNQNTLSRLWPRSLGRTDLTRTHASQGAVLLPLTVFISLSGIAMIYSGPVSAGLNALFGSNGDLRPASHTVTPPATPIDWPAQFAAAQAALPGAAARMVFPPQRPTDPVVWRLRADGEWHPNGRSYVVLDPTDNTAVQVIDARTTGLGPAVFNALYPLHAGGTGWPGHRWVLLVIGLSLIFMSIAGLRMSWLKRRRAPMASRA